MKKRNHKGQFERNLEKRNCLWCGKLFQPDQSIRRYCSVRCVAKARVPSLKTRKKLSERFKGEKGNGWKGGVTPINSAIRHSLEYRLWREAVFKRDDWTCVWCGARSKKGKRVEIHADHIKPFAFYPELRFAIDNGRTLCIPCHETTETYKRKVEINRICEKELLS